MYSTSIEDKKKRKRLQTFTNSQEEEGERDIIDRAPRLTLAFRVKPSIYLKYHRLSREEKRELREIFEQVVLGYKPQQRIINVNVAIAKAKAESSSEITIDPKILEKKLRIVEKEKKELEQIVKFYEEELRKREADIKELERRLREEREARARLVGYIRYVLSHSRPELLREELEKILEKEGV